MAEIGIRKDDENTICFFVLQGQETVWIPRISVIGLEQRYGIPVIVVDVDFRIHHFAGRSQLEICDGKT